MAGAEADAGLKDVLNLIKHAEQNQDHNLLGKKLRGRMGLWTASSL